MAALTVRRMASRSERTARGGWHGECGQASIEWIATVLFVSLCFAAAMTFVPVAEGGPLGGAIPPALVCGVKRDCHPQGAALRRAYGERDAELARQTPPNIVSEPGTFTLPIDYRRCRSHR